MRLKRTISAMAIAAMTLTAMACGSDGGAPPRETREPRAQPVSTQAHAEERTDTQANRVQSTSAPATATSLPESRSTKPPTSDRTPEATPPTNPRPTNAGPVILPRRTATPTAEAPASATRDAGAKPREPWREFSRAQYEELLPKPDEIRQTGITWTEAELVRLCSAAGTIGVDTTSETLQKKVKSTWAPRGYGHVFPAIVDEMQGVIEDLGGDYARAGKSARGHQLLAEAKCTTHEAIHPELPVIRSGMEIALRRNDNGKWDHWRVGAYWIYKETYALDEINRWIPTREIELIGQPYIEQVDCATRYMKPPGRLCE